MTLTSDYLNPPFDRFYMGRVRQPEAMPNIAPSQQACLRRLGTEWIALDVNKVSLINLVVVPDTVEGQGQAQALPCFYSGAEAPIRTQFVPDSPTKAGFLIASSADCPEGEHIIYGKYFISAQPYDPGDEYAAFRMQYNKLTTRVSLVQQTR